MKVRAKDSRVWADTAIRYRLLRHSCLPYELSKGLRLSDIGCLADMDLVSVQGDVPNRLAEKSFRYEFPCASQGDLRRSHGRLDRQEAETSNRFRALDPFRIEDLFS